MIPMGFVSLMGFIISTINMFLKNPAGKEAPHWGHKTSTNLVDFKEEAIFLSPEHSMIEMVYFLAVRL